VRIDRSDLADKSDDAHMAPRRTRSTPDDLDAAAMDQGSAGASDGLPDWSAAPPDSALRIERAVAYRAAVDAAYRQDAIDHGYARVEKTERETITPAIRRIEAEAPEQLNRKASTLSPNWPGATHTITSPGPRSSSATPTASDTRPQEPPQTTRRRELGGLPRDVSSILRRREGRSSS
jgi:hypothetical protein